MDSTKTAGFVRLGDTKLTVADPSEDIRGRAVIDRDGEEIGEVRSLFIDDVTKDAVRIAATREHVRGSVRFDPQLAPDERYWHSLYGYYGYSPYWAGR